MNRSRERRPSILDTAQLGHEGPSGGRRSRGGGDAELRELRRGYREAVECLRNCASVIDDLQSQLADRDELVASLEERIVRMSLELASSKAFEDRHRSRRRAPAPAGDDDGERSPRVDEDRRLQLWRPASRGAGGGASRRPESLSRSLPGGTPEGPLDESHRTFATTGGIDWGERDPERPLEDNISTIATASGADAADSPNELPPSRQPLGADALFRGNHDGLDAAQARTSRRRPSSRRREMEMAKQPSCGSLLDEGSVVFPSSFESVIVKGCPELGISFGSGPRGISHEGRRQFCGEG